MDTTGFLAGILAAVTAFFGGGAADEPTPDTTHAGIVDGLATIAQGKHLVLYVWYDNEFGYSNQVVRVAEQIVGGRPRVRPKRKHLEQM